MKAESLGDLLADATPDPTPLVNNLIWPESITLLAGRTKVGKTQFVLQLARAAVAGQPFLGHVVSRPLSVLYIGQEDARWALGKRMRGIEPRYDAARAAFHLLPTKGVLLEGKGVHRMVTQYRPELVILDPLRRFHAREEEKGEMAQVIREVDLLIQEFGCAVILVHHMRKPPSDKKRTPEVADVRGSSVITDQANTIALLSEDVDKGTFALTVTGNYTERQTLRLQRIGSLFERRGTHERLSVEEAVEAFADHPPLKRAEAVKVLMGRGLSRSQAYGRVREMEQAGWLREEEDGRLALNGALVGVRPEVHAGVRFGPQAASEDTSKQDAGNAIRTRA